MNPTVNLAVEQEYLVTHPDPRWRSSRFFAAVSGDCRYSSEPTDRCIEVKTGVCSDVPTLMADIGEGTRFALSILTGQGAQILPLALEPFRIRNRLRSEDLREGWIQAARGVGAQAMQATASTQFHLGIGSGDLLLYVHKELRAIGPLLFAVTLNSAAHGGRLSGLYAMRPLIKRAIFTGDWLPEETPERSWDRYIASRLKLCGPKGIMREPRIHNLGFRLRPDHGFSLEVCYPELVFEKDRLEAMATFLRDLVERVLEHYHQGDRNVPQPLLGSPLSLAIHMGVQEACVKGIAGRFVARGEKTTTIRAALEGIFKWLGGDYSALLEPTPAERMIAEFQRLHCCRRAPHLSCGGCEEALREICTNLSRRFAAEWA